MIKFQRDRSDLICIDATVNRRVVALEARQAGRIYAYLTAEEIAAAMAQFEQHGFMDPENPLAGGIDGIVFEHDLPALVDVMIGSGLDEPQEELSSWLLVFQQCARRLAEALLEAHNCEGPPPKIFPGE